MIIVFIGTVAAGKSTHKKLLGQYFKSRGVRFRTLNIAALGGLSKIIQLLSKKWLIQLERNSSWVAFKVRMMLLADIIWISAFNLPLLFIMDKILRCTLIIEDYFITSIMDYLYVTSKWYRAKYRSNKLCYSRSMITRISISLSIRMLRIFPIRLLIFMDAKDNELEKRQKARGTFEVPDYVKFRRAVLSKLLSIVDSGLILRIDTSNRSITDVHLEIVKALTSLGMSL
ncbi:MAG: hypothetical protein ACPLSM_00065 [Thermosphaera sp.]